jgi:hypothetical protein
MNALLSELTVALNAFANACASIVLAPVPLLPEWVSATVIAAVSGMLMLLMFKYTSRQAALKRVRQDINANLLALSLFRDSVSVSLRCQGRVLLAAGRLLLLSFVPVCVMCVPTCLLLSQLALWYQARPLHAAEEAVVTVHVRTEPGCEMPDMLLAPGSAVELAAGPVCVPAEQFICWRIRAVQSGHKQLTFISGGREFEKQLAVGEGLMRVSPRRPSWNWTDMAGNPGERAFPPDSLVQAIDVAYPERDSWTAGTRTWIWYWFAASMVFGCLLRPVFKVNL